MKVGEIWKLKKHIIKETKELNLNFNLLLDICRIKRIVFSERQRDYCIRVSFIDKNNLLTKIELAYPRKDFIKVYEKIGEVNENR